MRALLLFSLVSVLTSCGYVRPYGSQPGDPRGGPIVIGRLPLDTASAQLPVDTASGMPYPGSIGGGNKAARERRICRTERTPEGWAIRAYETLKGSCPGGAAEHAYNIAVLDRLSFYRYGDEIAICADQRIPSGWDLAPDNKTAECPGARVSSGQRTGLIIIKR